MKIISIVGKVDTRVVVYPLLKALSLQGSTAVVTEDGSYRRLYFGSEDNGTVSGVDIILTSKIEDYIEGVVRESGIKYDYVVTVSSTVIPSGANGVLVCKGIDKSINGQSGKEELTEENDTNEDNKIVIPDGITNKSLYISYESAPKDGIPSVKLKDGFIRYIYGCEETKELQPVEDKGYIKTLSVLLSDLLKIGEKELNILFSRKEYLALDGKVK